MCVNDVSRFLGPTHAVPNGNNSKIVDATIFIKKKTRDGSLSRWGLVIHHRAKGPSLDLLSLRFSQMQYRMVTDIKMLITRKLIAFPKASNAPAIYRILMYCVINAWFWILLWVLN